jgi:tRNA pseudouridine38-40 synthase
MAGMTDADAPEPTLRVRLDVGYDGTDFSGWARQPDRRTVQATIETAMATVLRLSDVPLTVAGRTDAGVHARGQVCHADLPREVVPDEASLVALHRRLGRLLPDDVRVHRVQTALAGFDARFSAVWRRYVYRVCDRPELMDPLRRREVLVWPRPLDQRAMAQAAERLLGEHDFATFCKRREGATTIRTLLRFDWKRVGAGLEGTVVADAFCHSMVRAMVGAVLAVGEGRRSVAWVGEALAARDRSAGSSVVPALGLTLEEVGYPPPDELATRASTARAVRTEPGAHG